MKTIKEKLILKNRFVEAYNNEIIDFNGNAGEHFRLGKIGGSENNGVCILPINDKGEIYIHQEYKYGIQGYTYTIPCGGAEPHLSFVENANKELLEETSLVSEKLEELNITPFHDPSIKNSKISYFIARDCKVVDGKYNESTEDFRDGQWINIEALYEMIIKGEIQLTTICLPIIFSYYIETILKNNFNKK